MAMEPLSELSVAAECERFCQPWREAMPDVMVENMAILIIRVGLASYIGKIAAQWSLYRFAA
ncbi:hypothetical protein ACJ2_16920 [Pantoea sp. QMID2]|nr:hypothetical protein ACJ3_24920 [Pantoea sp. QMID3]GME40208.1 hypothetical protein ACJ1_24760 [Pantoea sp. QMID1]GME54645.1 hypothetical protein ACJ4_16880 [Pantoea sp. QMID4]GME55648.1 hypothetical protein ACJ2_16920 [Pantoea sp. QMID2]